MIAGAIRRFAWMMIGFVRTANVGKENDAIFE